MLRWKPVLSGELKAPKKDYCMCVCVCVFQSALLSLNESDKPLPETS